MCEEKINVPLQLDHNKKVEIVRAAIKGDDRTIAELLSPFMPGLTTEEAAKAINKAHKEIYIKNETARLERKLKALEEEKEELNERIWQTKIELYKLKNEN